MKKQFADAINTAPAEMSFANLTKIEYLFLYTASKVNSVQELIISSIKTSAIEKKHNKNSTRVYLK